MPRLARSCSITFALVFGFLSVLTIFDVSSGGLKADTPEVSAADATIAPHSRSRSMAYVGFVVTPCAERGSKSVCEPIYQRVAERRLDGTTIRRRDRTIIPCPQQCREEAAECMWKKILSERDCFRYLEICQKRC